MDCLSYITLVSQVSDLRGKCCATHENPDVVTTKISPFLTAKQRRREDFFFIIKFYWWAQVCYLLCRLCLATSGGFSCMAPSVLSRMLPCQTRLSGLTVHYKLFIIVAPACFFVCKV